MFDFDFRIYYLYVPAYTRIKEVTVKKNSFYVSHGNNEVYIAYARIKEVTVTKNRFYVSHGNNEVYKCSFI